MTEPRNGDRWVCARGHEMISSDWLGDDCPHRDREDGSYCGAPMNRCAEDNRLELVGARCDVETVERLRQSYEGQVDGMSNIERIELLDGLPASGRSVELARELCRVLGDPALREENDSLRRQLRGAVEREGVLCEAINAALGYISADIDSDDGGNARRLCEYLRACLGGQ